MKKIIQFSVLALFCVLLSLQANALTVYKINATISTRNALPLENKPFGIMGRFANKQCTVKIYLRTDRGENPDNLLLYGAFSTATNVLQEQAFVYDAWYPTDWLDVTSSRIKSTDYKTAYLHALNFLNQNKTGYHYVDNIPVYIVLELEEGARITDLLWLRLPGIGQLDQRDFENCDNTPGLPGCAARKVWMDVSGNNKNPIVVAHRGYHGDRATPENSRTAIMKALDSGYQFIELDIRMTLQTPDNMGVLVGVPFLFHDNRLGYATNSNDTLKDTEAFKWLQIQNFKYRTRYGQFEQLSFNTLTSSSFTSTCDYLLYRGGRPLVFLDIKSSPMSRNFKTMATCIQTAFNSNQLQEFVFKMVRTHLTPGHESTLNMSADSALHYLDPLSWTRLVNKGNVHVVDYNPAFGKSFIDDWIGVGNVVGLELDFSKSDNSDSTVFWTANPSLGKKINGFGGLSPLEYYKNMGIRVGLWSSTALDCRGRPGHDPSKWSAGPLANGDNRARLEFISKIAPQYITHDRPDIVKNYLISVGRYNPNTILP